MCASLFLFFTFSMTKYIKLLCPLLQLQADGDMLVSEASKWTENDMQPSITQLKSGLLNWHARKYCQGKGITYVLNLLNIMKGVTWILSRKCYAVKDFYSQHAKLHSFLLIINRIYTCTFKAIWVILFLYFSLNKAVVPIISELTASEFLCINPYINSWRLINILN